MCTPEFECCRNCLNAHNNPYEHTPICSNKQFDAQFWPTDVHVRPDETCGRWTRRKPSQAPLIWAAPIQLTIDFNF